MKRTKDPTSRRLTQASSGDSAEPVQVRPAPWLPSWLVALTFIAIIGAGSYAVFHFFILTRVPRAMLGTWVVVDVTTAAGAKGDEALMGGTLEFRRDGTMIGTINMDGKEGKIKATVEVDEETMRISSVNPSTGQKVTDVQTIRTLDGDRFVIEDRKGTVLVMERLRE
jgi:hypothetical protein